MLFVLWCMSIANFIFIAVKQKLKIFENVEHVHAPKSLWVHVGEVSWGSLERRLFGVESPRLLLGVPAWGSLLLADGTLPPPWKFVIVLWQSFIN